jgi:hypothetical protein
MPVFYMPFLVPSQKYISVLEAQTAMLRRLYHTNYDFSHSSVFLLGVGVFNSRSSSLLLHDAN